MPAIGRVVSITRYPVKSMAGETVARAYLTRHGLEHDRLYAFESSGAPPGMLRLTSRERREMLRYQAILAGDVGVEVLTPVGVRYAVDSPELLAQLQAKTAADSELSLSTAETPQTDVRPLSLLSVESVQALSGEFGEDVDPRRFRANLLLTLDAGAFAEETWAAGTTVAIGREAQLQIRERTPRCRFITCDPERASEREPLFSLMKLLDRKHAGRIGVYASVLRPGWIEVADEVELLPEL